MLHLQNLIDKISLYESERERGKVRKMKRVTTNMPNTYNHYKQM